MGYRVKRFSATVNAVNADGEDSGSARFFSNWVLFHTRAGKTASSMVYERNELPNPTKMETIFKCLGAKNPQAGGILGTYLNLAGWFRRFAGLDDLPENKAAFALTI